MVVSGFIEPLVKELPMEYAVEMNRLIQLQMEGSVEDDRGVRPTPQCYIMFRGTIFVAAKVATGIQTTNLGFSKNAIEELSRSKKEPSWVLAKRLEAWHLYEETPLPAPNDELWRRTSLKDLNLDLAVPFVDNSKRDALDTLPEKFQKTAEDENASGVLVQHNSSNVQARLDAALKKRGVIFCDIDTAIQEHPDLVKEYLMTKAVTYNENRYKSDKPRTGATGKHEGGGYGDTIGDLKFVALHGAFFSGGTFLYVPRGVAIDLPLSTLTYFDSPNAAAFTHTLIVLEDGASARMIDEYASNDSEPQRFSAGAVELILKPGSNLQYFHLQDYAHNVWHFSSQTALLEKDSSLTWLVGTLGSESTKAFLDCKMLGAVRMRTCSVFSSAMASSILTNTLFRITLLVTRRVICSTKGHSKTMPILSFAA
jgi:Fe-S cluster assembly protein SufD